MSERTISSRALRRSSGAAFLFILVTLAPGCVETPPPFVIPEQGVEQEDFWVPPSFDLVRAESFTQIVGLRSWEAKYRGRESIQEITPRYVSEMPKLGWQLQEIRRVGTSGDKILTFYKGDEQTYVKIAREFDGSFGGFATAIEARIGPRPVESFGDARAEISALRNKSLEAAPREGALAVERPGGDASLPPFETEERDVSAPVPASGPGPGVVTDSTTARAAGEIGP